MQQSLSDEQLARTESDSNLQEQISRNKTNLESESSTRASKDIELENAITKEISDRQTAISNESSARIEAISNEQTIRATTDTALNESISKEVSDRQDADTNLYNILYLGLYIDEDGDICQR